jgi:hypothetical protein
MRCAGQNDLPVVGYRRSHNRLLRQTRRVAKRDHLAGSIDRMLQHMDCPELGM